MIFILISFILDGVLSLLMNQDSIYISLLSIMALIVVYPYIKDKQRIVIMGGIVGLLYDVVYTQTLFLNTILFCFLALVVLLFYKYIPINIVNSYVLAILLILLFRILSYLALIFYYELSFNWEVLFKSIYSSLITNLLYLTIMPFILGKIEGKRRKKRLLKI